MAMTEEKVTVADYLVSHLESLGVKHAFVLPGGGSMYLIDALARSQKITAVPMLHEQAAGIAAESYSQFNNELSVVIVTTGPGGTNAVTPCAAAYTDSTPVLFVSGQVKRADSGSKTGVRQFGFQEIPITEVVRPITKSATVVNDPDAFPRLLEDAIDLATSGRSGPVWLDIPLDVQSSDISVDAPKKDYTKTLNSPLAEQVPQELIQDWISSKRPIVMLGNGVRLAGGLEAASSLIQITQTPALLTWKMLDIFDETYPLNAGRPGAIAQRWANLAQQASDFILVIGARLDTGQTAFNLEGFAPLAKKYIVEVDAAEIKKFPDGFTTIRLDAGIFLNHLLQSPELGSITPKPEWIRQIKKWKRTYPLYTEKPGENHGPINLYAFMDALSRHLGKDAIVAPGSSGACSEVTMQAFAVKKGQRVFNSEGLGSMGFGIPGAIGASLASGGKQVICIDGDGGFLMNIQELSTVTQQNLPIKFFVLNNQGYGSIRRTQDIFFEGRRLGIDPDSGLGLPDLEEVSKGFGLTFSRFTNLGDLRQSLPTILSSNLPEVIELMIDLDHSTGPRVASQRKLNGEITSNPMHCLSEPVDDLDFLQLTGFSTTLP
jgi:acetolactate synthase-1/2/3 large subunit